MTTVEKVRKAVAEYLRIEPTQVTDDTKLGHMATTFIVIKVGLPWSGMVGETTVAELITQFEASAETHEPAWEYEDTPQIKSVRDAVVVAVAKHKGIKAEKVTDDTLVELKGYVARNAFSNHMFRLLGFSIGSDWRDENKTVRQLTADYEGLHAATKHGV